MLLTWLQYKFSHSVKSPTLDIGWLSKYQGIHFLLLTKKSECYCFFLQFFHTSLDVLFLCKSTVTHSKQNKTQKQTSAGQAILNFPFYIKWQLASSLIPSVGMKEANTFETAWNQVLTNWIPKKCQRLQYVRRKWTKISAHTTYIR